MTEDRPEFSIGRLRYLPAVVAMAMVLIIITPVIKGVFSLAVATIFAVTAGYALQVFSRNRMGIQHPACGFLILGFFQYGWLVNSFNTPELYAARHGILVLGALFIGGCFVSAVVHDRVDKKSAGNHS